ncbi:hypothetical protein [Neobacillus sp. 19]|uniref:hypothetical protein n=1 Tax=Neobacillus sp. 19 TaxID=3394458 RepID=UPI003BF6390F
MRMKDLTPPQRLFLTEILKGRIDVRPIFDNVFKQLIRPNEDGTAHLEALSDYYFLFKPTISNSESLSLQNNDVAQKIPLRLNLPTTVKTKNRIYHLFPKKVTPCALS